MPSDEKNRPVAQGSEIASPELEMLVRRLQEVANMMRISVVKARPSVVKREGNPFFRTLVQQQYQVALPHLQALMRLDEVVYSDQGCAIARDGVKTQGKLDQPQGIHGFLAVCEEARETAPAGEKGNAAYRAELLEDFQALVDELFSEKKLKDAGCPCAGYRELLGLFVEVPEVEEEPPRPPAAQAPPAAAHPPAEEAQATDDSGVLYERDFEYEGPDKPPRRALGEMCIQFLRYTRHVPEEEALRLINPATLQHFERYILGALGKYRGGVRFFVARTPSGELKVDLLRLKPGGAPPS
jgi:hypothetical protein